MVSVTGIGGSLLHILFHQSLTDSLDRYYSHVRGLVIGLLTLFGTSK